MKTIDISGFGGNYEAACQQMLLRGIAWLKEHPDFDFSAYKTYKNVYGLCSSTTAQAEDLDKVICAGLNPSGAMHQGVISHLAYIHKNGYDEWLSEASKHGRQVIEVDESKLEYEVLIGQIEWQLKLDKGYNPLAELFKSIPTERIITIDPNDPDSVKAAVKQIADIIKKAKE